MGLFYRTERRDVRIVTFVMAVGFLDQGWCVYFPVDKGNLAVGMISVGHPIVRPRLFTALFLRMIGRG